VQRGRLFLAGTPLIERRAGRYALRPRADLERLLGRAYGEEINLDRLMPGFPVVASALAENNLCLAQIAAVQLRVPDLPDRVARRGMEAEDLLIKRSPRGEDDRLARTGWDSAEHPRAGVPPNPGWFAPPTALAAVRHRLPRRRTSAHRRKCSIAWLRCDRRSGTPRGGLHAARNLFDYLKVGGRIVNDPDLEGTLIKLPSDAGYITFRATSISSSPAVDINVPGVTFRRIHFK